MSRPKGFKHSIETKRKMSAAKIGKKGYPCSFKVKIKNTIRMTGKKGKASIAWKGGRHKQLGYIMIYKPNHPFSDHRGYIREHRFIVEKIIGRFLKPREHCHHINRIRDDNRPENLMAFKTKSDHVSFDKWEKDIPDDRIVFDGRLL